MGNSNQKNLVIGLAVIVVLLIAIVGVLLVQTMGTDKTTATPNSTTTTPTNTGVDANGNPTGGMAGTTSDTSFDKATAQKVPADSTPQKWVEGYYKACDKKDWKGAWGFLPTAKRETTSADALGQQLSGYGITGWKISGSTENNGELQISADQTTNYGTFTSVWSFVKADDGKTWLLKAKAVAGMQ